MYLDAEKKKEFFAKHGKGATDTGSPEGQIAMFSFRIAHLTEHLKQNRKDFNTQRALINFGRQASQVVELPRSQRHHTLPCDCEGTWSASLTD